MMSVITLSQAAAWCGGKIDPKYADVTFGGANIDSRQIAQGELFVALRGARDGHDFIPMALKNGAAAVLCNRADGDFPAIIVDDTRIALGAIAHGLRQHIGMKVVAVTGSVGKSTTKEMIARVLATQYRVEKTPANHNNDLGMPMSVLSMGEDTEIAVLEMGMNHFGEISYLTNIAQPDAAVIVNIGTMHIEHLGSREGILKAKLEILEGLKPGGKVLLNGDDDMLWQSVADATYFGAENALCGVRALNVHEEEGRACFDFEVNGATYSVKLIPEGMHYVSDALAAVSVGLAMGVSPEHICCALETFSNMAGRQEIFEHKGFTVIKDCYNAGPESMAAALQVLSKRSARRVAVLGDMLELGAHAASEHYRVGALAARCADFVLAYGPNSIHVLNGAAQAGMALEAIRGFTDADELVSALKEEIRAGDVLLVKGSHGMHLDVILERFITEEA